MFRGRLRRLHYLAACCVLSLVVGCIIAGGFWIMRPPPGSGQVMRAGTTLLILAIPMLPSFWIGFSIQAARIRDIGWNPAILIAASLAIQAAAYLVPLLMPEGTTVEIIAKVAKAANIAYGLGLLFLPSNFHVPDSPSFDEQPTPTRPERVEASPARRLPSRSGATFGRRGL
ncbi:hypothetical protein EFQ99_33575 [Rhizobium vallis]|uniref:DUF805 domain-containing protein n=2 Tax=Rhizobium vallis TaxID=634290 RepID=A0A432PAQ4_9HYPH|nr:hypothetical protein EFQ99_33575 [Rhizobium vallis]